MSTVAPAEVPLKETEAYRNRYLIAFTVTMAAMLELLDTSIVNVALPEMQSSLGASLDQIAWVLTGYVVANAIVIPASGWLSSLFGRKHYFAGSLAVFTLASFLCGNAGSLEVMVFARILQGLGGGALLATAQATLYEVFPPEEFGKAQAIFGMGVVVGPTLGPTLGGYITDAFSWHWIFYINIPLGLVAILLTLSFLPDSRFAQQSKKVDTWGIALLVLGIGSLQLMLDRGESQDWFNSAEIIAYAVLGAGGVAAFVWRELTIDYPIVDLRVLKDPQFAAGTAFGFVLGVCLFATVFVLPVYLQSLLGYTAWQTGLVILPGALATAFTNGMMGRFGRKADGRILIAIGIAIFSTTMFHWSRFTLDAGVDDFFWPLITRGIGLGFIFVPLSNLALASLPTKDLGTGSGLYNLSRQLGGSVGIAVVATLLSKFRIQSKGALNAHVTMYDPAARSRFDGLTQLMQSHGASLAEAKAQALAVMNGLVTRQAAMLSFEKIFLLFGLLCLLAVPLLFLMKSGKMAGGGGAAH